MKIRENKIAHIHRVAECMYEHASEYELSSEEMYILGLLHDIGYLKGATNHAVNGSKLLQSVGYDLYDIVAWHGKTPAMYMEAKNVSEIPKELILLWAADLTIGSDGSELGFNERLKDIANRYGVCSTQYKNAEETVNWLISKGINTGGS